MFSSIWFDEGKLGLASACEVVATVNVMVYAFITHAQILLICSNSTNLQHKLLLLYAPKHLPLFSVAVLKDLSYGSFMLSHFGSLF